MHLDGIGVTASGSVPAGPTAIALVTSNISPVLSSPAGSCTPSIPASAVLVERPYHAKRPHRKSRTGCHNCKARKVKCDEGRPACRACTARKQTCTYPAPPQSSSGRQAPRFGGQRQVDISPEAYQCWLRLAAAAGGGHGNSYPTALLSQEPMFVPAGRTEADMRLLRLYTTSTYISFDSDSLKVRNVSRVLTVDVVRYAFADLFLMNCLLGISAMHANRLNNQTELRVPCSREYYYRARAFEEYRLAIEAADPSTFPALIAGSLLMTGLATHAFYDGSAGPLQVLDWMVIWRGIGVIVDRCHMVGRMADVVSSGLAALIYRPEVDLDAAAGHIPANLVYMVASIREGDPDHAFKADYEEALRYTGTLYQELRATGISAMLELRIMTYFTFLSRNFIDITRRKRPRALVILAYFLVFVKLMLKTAWWTEGIAEHSVPHIARHLGPEWASLLRVPVDAVGLTDEVNVVRLLLNDPFWDLPGSSSGSPVAIKEEPDEPEPETFEEKVRLATKKIRRNYFGLALCNGEDELVKKCI